MVFFKQSLGVECFAFTIKGEGLDQEPKNGGSEKTPKVWIAPGAKF
jgi:hypothetical protein